MMNMSEVARELGLSKATVSLAVNGKPGVSDQTRTRVLQYIEEQKKTDPVTGTDYVHGRNGRILKILVMSHKFFSEGAPDSELYTGVMRTFDEEARKRGYSCGISFVTDDPGTRTDILNEVNGDLVAGTILFGMEMTKKDEDFVAKIHKPVIYYDYADKARSRSAVLIDDKLGVEMAVDHLMEKGIRQIFFFTKGSSEYNFRKRRQAFIEVMYTRGEEKPERKILSFEGSIPEMTEQIKTRFLEYGVPSGMIFESGGIALAALNALTDHGLMLPEGTSAVGIDEIPSYISRNGIDYSSVRIPHKERAVIAVKLLADEIDEELPYKVRVMMAPHIVPSEKA